MPLLSDLAQQKKINYFLINIPRNSKILEIGSGSGWASDYLKTNGWKNYTGMDIVPPAEIVGDIHDWKALGLEANAYDVIIAFEVIEHVDCFKECLDLLKPGGKLLVTTPFPAMDWVLVILEFLGLNQKRTSPHSNLMYLKQVSLFNTKKIKIIMLLSQWGVFTK